ncbi:thiol-disulfide oxidoreductase DCC family protein [Oceaniglobus indicus]|uniref:thiol-disulfide oxidoreductase DCC family protein n=1 Tax=Oceaniglobus indicus TaxID=2047749 RepID=UPI000C1A21F3|nr:DUF393 domain-containing protein [Oceaniglobus indicus]
MTENIIVIYNHTCPVCRREIDAYRRTAESRGLPLTFQGIDAADLSAWGLTPETAARRLHVIENGKLLSGVAAFAALWDRLPKLRWLARLVRRPMVRPLSEALYERLLAPALYAMHRRRIRRLR